VALRGYVRHAGLAQRLRALEVVWHRRLRPGYGWIFPCRDGVFNVGVGISHSHRRADDGHGEMADVNLREVFDTFIRVHPAAHELMAGGERMGALKGAPLRYSLEGARYSRDGLLVTGEAAGSTYSFTGEGIGKALETGLLAAQAIVQGGSDADVRALYEQRLLALKPRFDLYERANLVNAHPWLADLVIWRARRSERLLRRMSGVLEETSNPGHLISLRGMARLFVE
jgi:flavin-dependent dehydrogenase